MPQAKEGDFIWTRSKTVYSDGTFALAYMVSHYGENGERGATGVSVTNVVPEYRLSNLSTALTGTGTGYTWSTKKPSVQSDQYIWERQRNELSDGSVAYSEATCDVVMSGLVFDVDQNKNAITSKVWQTDIESKINQYDDAAGTTIRNRVTKTEQDINGIFSQVLDIGTTGEGDQIQYTSQRLSAIEQTAEDITSTVESKYATKAEVGSNNLYVIADQVPGYLHQSNGSISTQNATGKEFTSAYIPVKENESIVIQSWCTPLNQDGTANPGYSWLAYQFFSDDDPVTPIGNRAAKWGYTSGSGVETSADGVEHLTYTVTAPANAKYIRVSYRSYEDGYAMVEKADTPSEYAINPKDLQNYTDTQVSSVRTIAEQTADKFTWLVESGDSSSNFTLTDRAAQLVAQYINLNGTVTFSAFDADTQNALTSGAELIVGTQASSTSAWTGKSTKLKSLASGTRISYKLPYASTSTEVTLNMTLNNNTTTGAKNVYYLNDIRLTTQYGANSIVELIYDGSAWRVINPYSDQNIYDRTRYQQPIKAGSVAIAAGNIIVAGANNVGTYTHLKRGQAFDTTYPILYAGSAISANSTGTDNYLIVPMGISTTQSGSYTAYKAVYIKGTLSGTTFTPISTTPLTQTIPTSADNYHYILLGTMYSTTEMYLLGEHPIFAYYNGGFKTVAQIAAEAATSANNANNTATTALNGIKAFTGTCTTVAGEPAKVVTSDNSFTMTNGVTITITFSTASTADAPTLDVNSLGAKAIYFDKAVASSTNRFRWKAGSVITFQYNGTNWVVLDYKNIEYTSSSTANNEAVKTNSSTDGTFVLCRGTTINVYFSEANTANAPKLNIDGTGEIPIYYKGAEVNSSNKYLWAAGSTFTFTYNGASRWYMTDGGSKIVKDYAQTAVDWVDTNGSSVITAKNILDSWKGEAEAGVTTINGGLIQTHTITANNLATDAIISNGYTAEASSVYSTVGTFLDLANGNIKSPTFAVDNTNGTAYIDGTIQARNLLVGTAAAELSSSGGLLNSSQGALVGNALDSAGDYLIYDGESILIKTDNFSIDPEGNVSMTGNVEAQSGSIGGWEISDDNLHYGSPIGSSGSVYLIPQGSTTWHSVGGSYETNGWVITAGENFGVTKDGALYANDANITGAFTITDGGIGGMTIDSDTISTTTSGMSSNTSKYAFWAGETNGSYGTTSTNAKFKVGHDGKLTASNADITGKITASDGTIGGWKIGEDRLYYSTAETPQVGDSNSVFLMPNGTSSNVTIAGVASRGWVITAGDSFGVTKAGYVYANYGKIGGVTLSGGNIYAYNTTGASSGSVAFQLLSNGSLSIGVGNQITMNTAGVLSIPALCITGELTANQIAANAITASKLSVTIGGNNLLRDSHANKTGSSTPWIWSYGPNPPKSGDKLTFQVKGSSLGSSQQIVTFGVTHTISLVYNSTTGTYVGTLTLSVSNSSDTYFRLNPGSTSATCDWVKLEYGDMPTPWSPSPDEAAGFDVDATAIHTSGVLVTSNADNSVALSSADFTRTINGKSRSGLRFAIGANFGITGTGKLYANDAVISGNITASDGQIAGLTIDTDRLYKLGNNGNMGEDGSMFIGASNYGSNLTVAGYTTPYWRLTVGKDFGVTGSTVYGKRIRILNASATRWDFTDDTTDYTFTVQNVHPTDSTKRTTLKIGAAGEAGMMIKNSSSKLGGFIVTNGNEMGIINWTNASNPSWPFRYSFSNSSSYITGTNVYINGSPYTSSDERIKTIHRTLNDDHKKLFMSLKPIEYSFVDRPGERHFGLGAQTTESSMNELGFGAEYGMVNHSVNSHKDQYGMDESYYLNYTEALMLSVPVVQDHEKEIAKLKAKIEELENKLSQLTQ